MSRHDRPGRLTDLLLLIAPRRMMASCVACAWLLLTFSAPLAPAAEEIKTLAIGAAAPDFKLPGVDDRTYTLADFADARVLVLVFTCNHCPTAQAYEERLIRLQEDYKDRGVAVVAVSPNDPEAVNLSELGYTDVGDSFEDMQVRAQERKFPFPYLYDGETQKMSLAYGVQATPHVYIFDAARTLRYTGRVDDGEVEAPKSHDARNAIDALLAGRAVPAAVTKVFGCSTKWNSKRAAGQELLKRWQAEEVALAGIDAAGVKKLAAGHGEKYRLINVWATWCGPCVDELPQFVDINRMYRRRPFELITISYDDADEKAKVLQTLKESYASTTNYLFTGENKDALVEALDPEWAGPVPYTVLIGPDGEVVYCNQGPIEPLALKKAIVERLGRTYAADRKTK
jgi:peroxiredoxin